MRAIYSLLHYLAMPAVLARLVWRGRRHRGYWERWGERFGFVEAIDADVATVWVHAVSVGEVQAALPVVQALQVRYPRLHVVLTTTTPTGSERVNQTLGSEVVHYYAPYDLPDAVRRFLERVHPSLVVILETELWPNLLHVCGLRAIPVLLANVRLSERSARGYRRIRALAGQMLGSCSAIAAQSREDAERLIALGARPAQVITTGSVKFDVILPASLREEAEVLRRCWGVDRSVWIAASTHEGEEEQVLDAFSRVIDDVPDCLLVLVPRHPERFASAAAICRKRGFSTALRSAGHESCADYQVFVGDSMGELPIFYAASDLAYVGGSLVDIGGHNMLEPAALGVPIIVGPYVHNFSEITRRLCQQGAAVQVADSGELGRTVLRFLQDANYRHNTGERGHRFVEANRGAVDRVIALIDDLLPDMA